MNSRIRASLAAAAVAAVLSGGLVASPATAAAPPAPAGTYEETYAGIAYTGTWTTLNTTEELATEGALTRSNTTSTVTLSFLGDGISWYGWKAPDAAIADVYIDGALHTVDLYAPTVENRSVLFYLNRLGGGVHTIEIRSTGRANPASTGRMLTVDAFVVAPVQAATYEESSPNTTYTGTWTSLRLAGASGGSIKYATGNVSAKLTFEGDSVTWYASRTPKAGISAVYINGVKRAEVDNYSATTQPHVAAFTVSGLNEGHHTIEIRPTGRANPAAAGKVIHHDSFVVGGF